MSARLRLLISLLFGVALAGCSVTQADTDQLTRMRAESPEQRTRESIACHARDLVCARLIELRGLACASEASDHALAATERERLRACALVDARTVADVLPADAGPGDAADAGLLIFDAWRAAYDAGNSAASPTRMSNAEATLAGLPGATGYGRVLASNTAVFDVLANRVPAAEACERLTAALQGLPGSAEGHLKDRADEVASAARSALVSKGCQT